MMVNKRNRKREEPRSRLAAQDAHSGQFWEFMRHPLLSMWRREQQVAFQACSARERQSFKLVAPDWRHCGSGRGQLGSYLEGGRKEEDQG